MKRATFKFKTEKSWLRVFKALNDTMYVFTAPEYKKITIWGDAAINALREACNDEGIKFEIVFEGVRE